MSYDDDLKKRMERARAQGMSEDDIQRHALIQRATDSQKTQQIQRDTQQKELDKQTKQNSGTFSAGNPIGFATSLLPFGEILRKKLNNEDIGFGDVALETVLSALPFAGKLIGKGAKAIKGAVSAANVARSVDAAAKVTKAAKAAKTASKVSKVAGSVDDVLREKNLLKEFIKGDPTQGVVASKLTKAGESLKAQARGVIPGVKPQGAAEKLLPEQADEINKTLNTVERGKTIFGRSKIGAKGSVNNQLRTVEQAQTKALGEMDDILTRKNRSLLAVGGKDKSSKEVMNNLNPSGGLLVEYNPRSRATMNTGKNITTIDKTMGGKPDDIITVYRGAPGSQKTISPGDYITTNRELAKSYTGNGNVIEMKVKKSDVLDDITEPLGDEYIYRPGGVTKAATNNPVASKIIGGMRSDRKNILGLRPEHVKEANDLEKRIASTKDIQGLEDLRRSADRRINFARNPNSPDPALEEVYMSLRRNIDKEVTNLIPELEVAKTNYGNLEAAKDTLIQNSPATMKQFAGQGATSRLLGGSVAQNLIDKTGRVLTRAGKIQASPVTKYLQVKAPFSAAGAFGSSQPGPEIPTEFGDIFAGTQDPNEQKINELYAAGVTDPQEINDALLGQGKYAPQDQTQVSGGDTGEFQGSSMDYANAANEAMMAGDTKSAKTYMDFAKTMADFEKSAADSSGGSELNVTKPTSEKYAQAVGGSNALTQLREIISKSGGVPQGTRVPGQDIQLFGIGSDIKNAVGTGEYDSVGFAAVDNMLRIATGAAAPDTEIRRYMNSYLPKPGDNEATIKKKLDLMESQFNSILNLAQPGGTNSNFDINQLFNSSQGAF